MDASMMKWVVRAIALTVGLYVVLFATVLAAMMRPPEQFGVAMRYLPAPLVWGGLPAPRMWLWARGGTLAEGEPAPDFTLPTLNNREERVTLSSHRGQRPVVLVFGSYT
jgi:hypothetical protein